MIQMVFLTMFALAPPPSVRAFDAPNDGGRAIIIEWQLSPDDAELNGYEIYRSENDVDFEKIGLTGKSRNIFEDETEDGKKYYYKVAAVAETVSTFSEISVYAISQAQWIDWNKLNIFISFLSFA